MDQTTKKDNSFEYSEVCDNCKGESSPIETTDANGAMMFADWMCVPKDVDLSDVTYLLSDGEFYFKAAVGVSHPVGSEVKDLYFCIECFAAILSEAEGYDDLESDRYEA